MASASAIDGPTQRKMSGQGVVRARKGNSLVMPNEAMDIIRIVKSLANSGLLIDGVNETVKQEIKTRGWSFWYVIRNSWCVNVRQYVNWKRCSKTWKNV